MLHVRCLFAGNGRDDAAADQVDKQQQRDDDLTHSAHCEGSFLILI